MIGAHFQRCVLLRTTGIPSRRACRGNQKQTKLQIRIPSTAGIMGHQQQPRDWNETTPSSAERSALDEQAFAKWTLALRGVIIGTGVFGLGMAGGGDLMTRLVVDRFLFTSWGLPIPAGVADGEPGRSLVQFLLSLSGAIMVGWAASFWAVVSGEDWSRRHPAALRSITRPLLLWYAVDTSMSYAYGFTPNCALNTAFLISFGTPLFFLRRHF